MVEQITTSMKRVSNGWIVTKVTEGGHYSTYKREESVFTDYKEAAKSFLTVPTLKELAPVVQYQVTEGEGDGGKS